MRIVTVPRVIVPRGPNLAESVMTAAVTVVLALFQSALAWALYGARNLALVLITIRLDLGLVDVNRAILEGMFVRLQAATLPTRTVGRLLQAPIIVVALAHEQVYHALVNRMVAVMPRRRHVK